MHAVDETEEEPALPVNEKSAEQPVPVPDAPDDQPPVAGTIEWSPASRPKRRRRIPRPRPRWVAGAAALAAGVAIAMIQPWTALSGGRDPVDIPDEITPPFPLLLYFEAFQPNHFHQGRCKERHNSRP